MTRLDLRHRRLLPRSLYLGLLAVLVCAEYPLNASVFQVFALPRRETVVMAVGVGVALIALAHLIGVILARRGKVPDRSRTIVEIAFGVVLASVLVAGVVRLGLVRAEFLADMQRQVDLGVALSKGGLFSFTFIQLLIVVVAVGAAFFTHNEEADELERLARADRRAFRCERRTEKRLLTAERRVVQPQAKRDTLLLKFSEASAASAAWYDYLRWERRSANIRHHIEGPKPEFLSSDLPHIPPGAWTLRTFDPYRLPNELTDSGDGHRCSVRPPRRPRRKPVGRRGTQR